MYIMNTNIAPGINGMNSQAMMDSFKSMAITMLMVKGSNGTSENNSFINTIIMMLVISFIDTISVELKNLFNLFMRKANEYVSKKSGNISIVKNLTQNFMKTKKSSIIVKIEPATSTRNPTSDAIIDLLTHFPHAKCIILENGIYNINYNEEIEINKNLFARLVSNGSFNPNVVYNSNETRQSMEVVKSPKNANDVSNTGDVSVTNDASGPKFQYIELYSYSYDMEMLRKELNDIVNNYLIKMNNKLGNNIYYFTELPLTYYRGDNNSIDKSKLPETLHFRMKLFTTNRSFKNLFGSDINLIRKRAEFFRDNKDWYDAKGVPYTLGIMVSGNPGSGKTSVIKCIANELKRHIINIHLSDNMSKTQLENLFYNEQIHVTQNGKSETYTIPINKRVYVLEDVDCQCDVILDREENTIEQKLANENAKLKTEIENLKSAISQLSEGKKVIMSNNNIPALQKKEDTTNEKITLSFLLNLFDGVLETPGRIIIMTTNFIDKLDKAFTRPGRIDICCKLGFADYSQLLEIVEHRYDAKLTDEQLQTIQNIGNCITPAEIGRILFENFDNLDGAINDLVKYSTNYMEKQLLSNVKNKTIENNVENNDVENKPVSSFHEYASLIENIRDKNNVGVEEFEGFGGGNNFEQLL